MKHTFEKKSGSVIELKVELTLEEFNKYWQPAMDEALAHVSLKGFRPGQVPRDMAKNHVDTDKVFEQAAQSAVRFSLNEISQDNSWSILDKPEVTIDSNDKSFSYQAKITIFPEIELGDYKAIAKKYLSEMKEATVTEKELAESLEWLRSSRAKLEEVTRPSKNGDILEVDIESSIEKSHIDKFILGKANFLPGFEDNLVNHAAGDTVDFSIDVAVDYLKEDWRGKKIIFKVKINKVFDRQLPELNDDFIKGLSNTIKDLDGLKNSIKEGLLEEKQGQEKEKTHLRIIEELVDQSKMEVPKVLIDRVAEQMNKDQIRAKKRVQAQLVIYKIAQVENLTPTEE